MSKTEVSLLYLLRWEGKQAFQKLFCDRSQRVHRTLDSCSGQSNRRQIFSWPDGEEQNWLLEKRVPRIERFGIWHPNSCLTQGVLETEEERTQEGACWKEAGSSRNGRWTIWNYSYAFSAEDVRSHSSGLFRCSIGITESLRFRSRTTWRGNHRGQFSERLLRWLLVLCIVP